MCYVTATELKNNLSYYLSKSLQEDVYVTKNGNAIACLTNPKFKALVELDEILDGIKIEDSSLSDEDALKDELIKKHL